MPPRRIAQVPNTLTPNAGIERFAVAWESSNVALGLFARVTSEEVNFMHAIYILYLKNIPG